VKLAVYHEGHVGDESRRGQKRGVSCSDTLSYESVVIPETDNLTSTDMFAPLVRGSCTAKRTLLTCTTSCTRSVTVAGWTSTR
jgi:hypothetical protein